jgi:hypothetical protein
MIAKKNNSSKKLLKITILIFLILILPLFIYSLINYRVNVPYAASQMPVGTIILTDPSINLKYGNTVTFITTTAGKMNPKGYLYVRVICSQDNKVVYQSSSRNLKFPFLLTDQTGDGLDWNGGPADCQADLIYSTNGNRNTVIQLLDSVKFPVSGM